MSIVLLEAIQYPDPSQDLGRPRFGWRSYKTPYPEWEEIEVAIRRLDRDEWPFVWLHTEAPQSNDMPNNMFCVMGGRGEYDLCLYRDGDEFHYWNPDRSDESICIWESDQGSYKSYQNLCEDLLLVLRITRQFSESGILYDAVKWDTW